MLIACVNVCKDEINQNCSLSSWVRFVFQIWLYQDNVLPRKTITYSSKCLKTFYVSGKKKKEEKNRGSSMTPVSYKGYAFKP